MENQFKKNSIISRRGMLPILGSSLLIPFIGFAESDDETNNLNDNDSFQTLLKPDGSIVKVKISSIKGAKIIKKNITNKSFLKWLNKKF